MTRKYHRYEKGLETQEKKYLESAKMKRLIQKLSDYFNVELEIPKFRPVYINKRLRKYDGLFKGNRIDVADDAYDKKEILWHEMLHAVVYDNWKKIGEDYKNYRLLEKAVFQLEKRGNHRSHKYKLTCECGYWIKSLKKKHSYYCPRCDKKLVSKTEYNKLKKISEIKSRLVKVDIDRYKVWKSNEKIGLDI